MKKIKNFILLSAIITSLFTSCSSDDKNEAPTVEAQTFTVAEDVEINATVGTVTATDPENSTLSYVINGGNIGNVFLINASTGEITISSALDYELTPSYELIVEVSDGESVSTTTITVNVTDVLDDPTFENVTYQIVAGSVTDSGASDPVDYSANSTHWTWAFDVNSGDDETPEDFFTEDSFSIFFDLNSFGTTAFNTGTFEVPASPIDPYAALTASDVDGKNVITNFSILYGVDDNNPFGSQYFIKGQSEGSITITDNGNNNYTLDFNLVIAKYDWALDYSSFDVVPGTERLFVYSTTIDLDMM